MQKKILSRLILIALCGIVLSSAVFFVIQTWMADHSADEVSLLRLNDVETRMEMNVQQLRELTEIVREDSIATARSLALLLEMEPHMIEDSDKLKEIADALNVDEINIIGEDGVLRWGTQPYKFGQNYADTAETRPLLEILDNPELEIAQDSAAEPTQGVLRQYAAVSLRHMKGIAQVGVIPRRLLEQQAEMDAMTLLEDVGIGETGYIFSISKETGLVTYHPNSALKDRWVSLPAAESGITDVDGQEVRYHIRDTGKEILVSAFPLSEMYAQRTFSSVSFLVFTTLLFSTCCIIISLYIRRYVVVGIYDILHTLDEVSAGDLSATADVRQSPELSRLSDGINQMLSGIKEKIQEVSEAVVRAEEASRAKSSFLANMSHEIRTPMNGIIGMADLLQGERLSGRQTRYVKDIKTSAESLLGIINDILDLSKISEGKLMVSPVDMDLFVLLRDIISMMSFSAHCKDLKFIEDIQVGSPEYIRADDVRLKQILVNLISNAIKFTKMGHVKLTAKIDGDQICFEISDTGIGIKPEDIPLVFNAFEQVDQRRNRTIKGTGLGLSITKSLVDLMDGSIAVESEYGIGTTFRVTIPYLPGDRLAVQVSDADFKYIYAPKARVLLVDDIQTNLTVGAGLLRLCGISSDVVLSGAEAIAMVKANRYDIVFMDHMMPEMDGIEALQKIRALEGERFQTLPIIALTANAVTESRDFLLASGMDDFLSKPINKGALVAILKKWLPEEIVEFRETREDETQKVYSEILEAVSVINGIDIESALNRIGGLQDVLEESIKQMTFEIHGRLEKMKNSLAAGNLKEFSMEAHGFKGSLANIGAVRSSELAAELEYAAKKGNLLFCNNTFPGFSYVMQSLEEDLTGVFPPLEPEKRAEGTKDLLLRKTKEAIANLESFEAGAGQSCLKELTKFTFDEETDSLLRRAKTGASAFRYDEAVSLLKKVLEGIE